MKSTSFIIWIATASICFYLGAYAEPTLQNLQKLIAMVYFSLIYYSAWKEEEREAKIIDYIENLSKLK
tara:strand:+ start:320 stop:523 length:204 start_codon:yes stop_codon:yes gene_type:complete